MAKEDAAYRDNLAELKAFFGDKRLVTAADVANYTGRDKRFVSRIYQIAPTGITLPTLARRMCI